VVGEDRSDGVVGASGASGDDGDEISRRGCGDGEKRERQTARAELRTFSSGEISFHIVFFYPLPQRGIKDEDQNKPVGCDHLRSDIFGSVRLISMKILQEKRILTCDARSPRAYTAYNESGIPKNRKRAACPPPLRSIRFRCYAFRCSSAGCPF
jgi:hypothetical protein